MSTHYDDPYADVPPPDRAPWGEPLPAPVRPLRAVPTEGTDTMSATATAVPAPGSSWAPRDLGDVVAGLLTGTITRAQPTVGERSDGRALFYAGKVNGVAGPSGSGKSWAGIHACREQIERGHHAVYVDLEDDDIGVVGRLLDIGCDPDAVLGFFHYIRPDESFTDASAQQLAETLTAHAPTLVVIDSTGESMALDGAKPNDDDDTARWFRRLPTAVANRGPAVVVLDHVVKADDGGLWPIGSQRKRAAISGAQYMQAVVRPFSKDTPGAAKLVCAKDRHGNYRQGEKVAELTVTPLGDGAGDGVDLQLRAPSEASQDGQASFRPTALMERVSEALATAGCALGIREIDRRVTGKQEHITLALDILVREGHVDMAAGARNAKLHTLVKPYRQADDPKSDRYDPGDSHRLPTV